MSWKWRPAWELPGTCIQRHISLTVEIEGQGTKVLKAGEIALMPAEVPHLARNDGIGGARALVTHSRADKEKPFVVAVKRAT